MSIKAKLIAAVAVAVVSLGGLAPMASASRDEDPFIHVGDLGSLTQSGGRVTLVEHRVTSRVSTRVTRNVNRLVNRTARNVDETLAPEGPIFGIISPR